MLANMTERAILTCTGPQRQVKLVVDGIRELPMLIERAQDLQREYPPDATPVEHKQPASCCWWLETYYKLALGLTQEALGDGV